MRQHLALPLIVTALFAGSPVRAEDGADLLSSVAAGTIAAISDGDFVARSYADGTLAPESAGFRDLLTVFSITAGKVSRSTLPVSSSVTAAPEVLALTPDGRTAFVTERLGPRGPGARMARDLPPGNRIFAIDLSDKARPAIADTATVAAFPEGLALSPNGREIATVSNTPEASIVEILAFDGGKFGRVVSADLGSLGITGSAAGPRGGVLATNVQWHPSGRLLAVNIATQNRVVFLERAGSGPETRLRPLGRPVETGRDPFVGRFTPDGRHYLAANWGRDFSAKDLAGRLPTQRSTISVIRIAGPGAESGAQDHRVVATAESDRSSEGLAISPDGRLVATVNMRDTALPPPRREREGSVSLLSLDPDSGALTKIADYPLAGVLPEGGSFDLDGRHFLATVFEGHEGADQRQGAGLEVFRVTAGSAPRLERLGRVTLPHGPHHVVVAR